MHVVFYRRTYEFIASIFVIVFWKINKLLNIQLQIQYKMYSFAQFNNKIAVKFFAQFIFVQSTH